MGDYSLIFDLSWKGGHPNKLATSNKLLKMQTYIHKYIPLSSIVYVSYNHSLGIGWLTDVVEDTCPKFGAVELNSQLHACKLISYASYCTGIIFISISYQSSSNILFLYSLTLSQSQIIRFQTVYSLPRNPPPRNPRETWLFENRRWFHVLIVRSENCFHFYVTTIQLQRRRRRHDGRDISTSGVILGGILSAARSWVQKSQRSIFGFILSGRWIN